MRAWIIQLNERFANGYPDQFTALTGSSTTDIFLILTRRQVAEGRGI